MRKQGVQARCKLAAKRVLQQAQHQLSSALSDPIDMGGTHGATMLELCLPKMQQRVDRLLSELATLLIVPFFEQANLQLGQHLLVIPCRYLHQIPFQALRVDDTYLLEQCAVSYAPSLTVLSHTLENRVAASRRMLFVGYDSGNLDQIRAEVDTLRSCFADAVFYENDAATAQRFLSDASQFNVLHLTCHAQFREDKPMLSGFAFADRYLTLGEIALLDLPCELATLGACVTGYGQQHGTDMFSLAAAFMGAGARSLIVSQWRIDDEAARRLVDTFYHSLLRGSSRVEALREAQLVLLQLGRQQPKQFKFFKHPAYWAALCLHGNWHAITL